MKAALFQAVDAGLATEGPEFNLYTVINGSDVKPKSGMLGGISRKTVLEFCEAFSISYAATDINEKAFMNAEEVFTATTAGWAASSYARKWPSFKK